MKKDIETRSMYVQKIQGIQANILSCTTLIARVGVSDDLDKNDD